MTIINSQEDLLRALSENAEWRAAVRSQILGDELMNLPPAFNAFVDQMSGFVAEVKQFVTDQKQFNAEIRGFVAEQKQFNAEIKQFVAEQKQFNAEIKQFVAEQKQFNAEMKEFVAEQKQFNAEMKEFVAEQKDINARMELRADALAQDVGELRDDFAKLSQNVDGLTHSFDRLRDDVGQVKGYYARNWTEKYAGSIVLNMGLEYVRILQPLELSRMVLKVAAGRRLTANQRSFQAADIVIEATDAGTPCYIAVEVSFTADARDTNRALRNASMLTEYTGRRARAVIVSVRNDHSIGWQIESGAVYWHRIEERDVAPD